MTSVDPGALGVVVGKFHPPHVGHLDLIDHLHMLCTEEVVVIVCERDDQAIPGADRAAWLADVERRWPAPIRFVVTPDDIPDEPGPWAQRTRELIDDDRLDLVAVQDSYGPAFAETLGVGLVRLDDVDPPSGARRRAAGVSATRIKRDMVTNFDLLAPAARAALVQRVVLVGAESTGKTTLAAALADTLGTGWVPEYGRDYWAARDPQQQPTTDEFLTIARRQSALEDQAARAARRPWLICDTDPLVTSVWHERYLGAADPELEGYAASRPPDLYLLCGDDIPWHQDGTRESRNHRAAMQHRTRKLIAASGVPWVEVLGSLEERVAEARAAIDAHCPPPDLDGPPGSVRIRRAATPVGKDEA